MTTYVALLRGVNVGGNKMVAMADLRDALTTLGFADVRTVLQSGNVLFRGRAASPEALEARLEREVAARLGVRADFHVRTAEEWRAVVAANPFPKEAQADPGRLLVTFFKAPLPRAAVQALQAAIAAIDGPEMVRADGRHLYMVFPNGMGNSKAAPLIDRKLGARGTARNWNTVTKLHALAL